MAYNLGKMKRIDDLRSVWPHEANRYRRTHPEWEDPEFFLSTKR